MTRTAPESPISGLLTIAEVAERLRVNPQDCAPLDRGWRARGLPGRPPVAHHGGPADAVLEGAVREVGPDLSIEIKQQPIDI